MSDDKNNVIVIDEPQEEVVQEVEFSTEGLMPEEVEKAKEHGLIKEDKKDSEDQSESMPEEEKEPEEINKDPDNFEEMDKVLEEKGNKTFNETYTANQKGLYFKAKAERKKRQEAQTRYEELKAQQELGQLQDSVSKKKLERITELLKKDDLTVSELEEVINGQVQAPQETETPETRLKEIENEKKAQDFQVSRMQDVQEVGTSLHDDFAETVQIANEFVSANPKSLYAKALQEAFINPDVDSVDVVEMIYQVARLSGKEVNRKVDPKVERAVKNASKKTSSAAVTGNGSGKKTISYDDITPEIAARMTTSEWSSLPKKVRDRILQEQ